MTLKGPYYLPWKGENVSGISFFEESRFFEFVHGKYSEVGGGSLNHAKIWKTLVVCVCLMKTLKKKTTVMWLLTCSAFYVPQVWKVTLQNTPLFSQCRRGDPGGEGWFKNSSVVRIGLSWVCLALRGNCLWLWLFMEWGWVCLLLSKQKPQNKQNNNKKHVFRAIPGPGVKCLLGNMG